MRFGHWRGVTLALGLGCALAAGLTSTASAQFSHTIPPVAQAYDVNTGGPYYAPPVPYGCYAKDPGAGIHKMMGKVSMFHGGKGCNDCGGAGCGKCKKGWGHGHARDCDDCGGAGCGKCLASAQSMGHGHKAFASAQSCDSCGGRGCGLCKGRGLFHHGMGNDCSECGGKGCGACKGGIGGMGLSSLLHHGNKIKYFVGPGGPVPLTPGYVPYVVPVRSPRDYFAFPPFTPDAP